MTFISRRDLLKAAVVIPIALDRIPVARRLQPSGTIQPENLAASEMELLEAIVARLIPTDANGPGATEARAAHYIDKELGEALAASKPAYTNGLAALDRLAQSSRGASFAKLSAADQDAVLTDFQSNSPQFFALLLNHTHQGTFGDPYYGGNANFVGWDLLGYPGVRTNVTAADQQRMEKHDLKPNHKSAYDYESFTKASEDLHRGD
jgi:gluconate 2-dehydrogenase gamma chain